MQKPLVLIVQWFGPWPPWIDFFVESCKWNGDVDWLVYTDQPPPANEARNIRHVRTSFADHKALICSAIGIDPAPIEPFKLCDLRPMLGALLHDEIKDYRHYGHCDIDLIFGNIRAFYTDAVLARYDVLSTHADRLSGHLAVLRNNAFNRTAYRRIKSWKRKAADARNHGIDEYRFGKIFQRPNLWRRLTERRPTVLFEERFTTPMTRKPWLDGTFNHPTRWFWKDGRLTAEGYEGREFIYLHFMNWKSSTSHVVRNGQTITAPWLDLDGIVQMDWRRAGSEGFMISHAGIGPLPPSRQALPTHGRALTA